MNGRTKRSRRLSPAECLEICLAFDLEIVRFNEAAELPRRKIPADAENGSVVGTSSDLFRNIPADAGNYLETRAASRVLFGRSSVLGFDPIDPRPRYASLPIAEPRRCARVEGYRGVYRDE